MTASTEIDKLKAIGDELVSLLSICLDASTPEETRIILRKELKEIKTEIDKIIAENE